MTHFADTMSPTDATIHHASVAVHMLRDIGDALNFHYIKAIAC